MHLSPQSFTICSLRLSDFCEKKIYSMRIVNCLFSIYSVSLKKLPEGKDSYLPTLLGAQSLLLVITIMKEEKVCFPVSR